MLGRLSPGCEGTRGVFPKCNFGCTPCYHSVDANKVRIDGLHTVTEIARQMQLLHDSRGSAAHCQLIGGEVSLLDPNDHVLALETMRFFGRIPMSFTNGDFDYDYLKRLAIKGSRKRFDRIDFAVHFDIGMKGRAGTEHVKTEMDLNPFRKRFVEMFEVLRQRYGVRYYLAHNMTVQQSNLQYVAQAVIEMRNMGFRLLSFQPAAKQGNDKRWVLNLREVQDDDGEMVWKEIEKGMGIRLPYSLFQMGDVRCNRMSVCATVGPKNSCRAKVFPLFDDLCPQDVKARDLVMTHVGNIVLKPKILALKIFRILLRRPWLIIPVMRWCLRVAKRAGGIVPILRWGITPLTIVMHRFMDANDVSEAWQLMEAGVSSEDPKVEETGPRIRETMQRLASCSYAMAQPDTGRIVPACVQHSIYDPVENKELTEKLPLNQPSQAATPAVLEEIRKSVDLKCEN